MSPADVVRAAIPDASDGLVNYVIWARTPYPCGPVTPRELFSAARSYDRACRNKRRLCDWCHRLAQPGDFVCEPCGDALASNS